jgi:DNA-binding NarL/FixJ family response regulator
MRDLWAFRFVQPHYKCKENNPDLIMLDWELTHLPISDVIPALRHLYPSIKIVAMSSHPEASKTALAAGVNAFVSKGEQPEKLLHTLNSLNNKDVE